MSIAPIALGVGGGIAQALRKKHTVNWARLRDYLRSLTAEGSLSPEDLAAGEQTKSRLMTTAEDTSRGLRTEALRRARQRGTDLAPAIEATLSRVDQTGARLRQNAADTAEEQLYNVRLGNKRFEQQKMLGLASARIGDELGAAARDRAKDTTFWNSLLDLSGPALDSIDTLIGHHASTGATTSAHFFNPATGRLERQQDRNTDFEGTEYEG